jgi:BolA protein
VNVTAAEIERVLRAALAPETPAVIDDSHLHVGHAGAREGRHFSV